MNKIKVLVTSGGTKIFLDSVRAITNMSKGTFGTKIAQEFVDRFYDVTFLYAKESKRPTNHHDLDRINFVTYVSFEDYERELNLQLAKQPDIIVLAAAVSDYGVENPVNGKIRSGDDLVIRLKPLPKLISTVREKCKDAVICGFKLLVNSTDDELYNAVENSIKKNDCDLVVGNDLRDIKQGKHRLLLGTKTYTTESPVRFYIYNSEFDYLAGKVVDHCEMQYNNLLR